MAEKNFDEFKFALTDAPLAFCMRGTPETLGGWLSHLILKKKRPVLWHVFLPRSNPDDIEVIVHEILEVVLVTLLEEFGLSKKAILNLQRITHRPNGFLFPGHASTPEISETRQTKLIVYYEYEKLKFAKEINVEE